MGSEKSTNRCRECRFFSKEFESWEMPDIYWFNCSRHPQYTHLRSFPFENTKCADFARRERSEQ